MAEKQIWIGSYGPYLYDDSDFPNGIVVEGTISSEQILGDLNGDQVDIDFTPDNYEPDDSISEAADVNDLSAHLKGIDNALSTSALSVDPADPPTNSHVVWQSDGTASGNDGDIMIKITKSDGTTVTKTLIAFA